MSGMVLNTPMIFLILNGRYLIVTTSGNMTLKEMLDIPGITIRRIGYINQVQKEFPTTKFQFTMLNTEVSNS